MKKKIVIVGHEPLTLYVFKKFYISEFRHAGYIVEYRDISQLLYPKMKIPDKIEDEWLFKISNLQEYINSFNKDNPNEIIYIAELPCIWRNRKLFRVLRQKKRVVVHLNLYITIILPLSFWERFLLYKGKFIKLLISKIEQFAYKVYQLIYDFKNYDIEITSYSELKSNIPVFTINHSDFEHAQSLTDTKPIVSEPYAVFLDEYFPLHPDFEFYSGIKSTETEANIYRQKMCKFFDEIENKFKVKVIIAVHYKSIYNDGVFGNRPLIKYHTCELVKYSKFVLVHSSTSINFAVIFMKPMMIISLNVFTKYLDMMNRTEYISAYFSCPLVNLDNPAYSITEPKIDSQACNNFLYTYLTSKGKEKMTNSEILNDVFAGL